MASGKCKKYERYKKHDGKHQGVQLEVNFTTTRSEEMKEEQRILLAKNLTYCVSFPKAVREIWKLNFAIKTVHTLVLCSEDELKRLKGISDRTIEKVQESLKRVGLRLGMSIAEIKAIQIG